MNFIEKRLQNYLHCILALIEDNCIKLIASENLNEKTDRGIAVGLLGQAAEQLNTRINEIFDRTSPRICNDALMELVSISRKSGKFQKLHSWLLCDIAEFIRLNEENILLQKDVILLKQIQPWLALEGVAAARPATAIRRCFLPTRMRKPKTDLAYRDILKKHPFPGRPKSLRFSEQKIIHARSNKELIRDTELLKPFLHYVMIDVEISATEICAYNILRYQHMPVAFITDMARQIWDEARHARIIWNMLLEIGAAPGDYTYSNIVLRRYLKADSLEESLVIQQLLQEGSAVEINIQLIRLFRNAGRNDWADIFTVLNIDEGLHARIGNRWLQFLLQDKPARLYNRILKKASAKIDIPVFGKGGWDPKVRKQIGFPEQFIQHVMAMAT